MNYDVAPMSEYPEGFIVNNGGNGKNYGEQISYHRERARPTFTKQCGSHGASHVESMLSEYVDRQSTGWKMSAGRFCGQHCVRELGMRIKTTN
jgi:hypothetical protein